MIAETNDYVGEALIGLQVCQELGLPAMVTFASVQASTTYDGYDYVDACRTLADHGATVVGLNCSRGPETMLPLLEAIRSSVDVGVAAQPVPYRTSEAAPAFEALTTGDGLHAFPIQLEPFQCTRFEMADFARRAHDVGVDYIGICCGAGPHHVRAMAEALGRQTPAGGLARDRASSCPGDPARRTPARGHGRLGRESRRVSRPHAAVAVDSRGLRPLPRRRRT